MRTSIKILAALAACFGVTGAHARVFIQDDPSGHVAFGEMRAAATAGSESAYIYCELAGSAIRCGASNGLQTVWCTTQNPRMKQLFASIGRTSTIGFHFDPVSHQCGDLNVYNTSRQFDALSPGAFRFTDAPFVDLENRYAYGSMNSPTDGSSPEGVSCTVAESQVECSITDANAMTARCVADGDGPSQTLADMRLAAMAINESSFVQFSWEGGLPGRCVDLYVINLSQYLQ